MPGDGNDGMSHIGADVPANIHEALYVYATHRDMRSPRGEDYSMSTFIREAVREKFERAAREEELPEEVLDLLDEDLKANAGGTEEAEA